MVSSFDEQDNIMWSSIEEQWQRFSSVQFMLQSCQEINNKLKLARKLPMDLLYNAQATSEQMEVVVCPRKDVNNNNPCKKSGHIGMQRMIRAEGSV